MTKSRSTIVQKLKPVIEKLTRPTTADPRNLTQSIGVSPGFFFSGCQVKSSDQVIAYAHLGKRVKTIGCC